MASATSPIPLAGTPVLFGSRAVTTLPHLCSGTRVPPSRMAASSAIICSQGLKSFIPCIFENGVRDASPQLAAGILPPPADGASNKPRRNISTMCGFHHIHRSKQSAGIQIFSDAGGIQPGRLAHNRYCFRLRTLTTAWRIRRLFLLENWSGTPMCNSTMEQVVGDRSHVCTRSLMRGIQNGPRQPHRQPAGKLRAPRAGTQSNRKLPAGPAHPY